MIRKLVSIFLKYKIWLVVIMIFNVMFGVFLWLIDANGFTYIFPTMIIGSILLYSLISFVVYGIDKRKEEALIEFIENPDLHEEEVCLSFLSGGEKEIIHLIGEKLRKKKELIKKQDLNLKEYEEYIETWAHEIKTPLALMTFVLDNRKEEILFPIYQRLEYVRTKMQEDIERMLYYSRVKSEHLDYIFTKISLDEISKDVVDEYKNLIEEQKITINNEVGNIQVLSDKKGLIFVLRQVLSNSIKYMDREKFNPFITLLTKIDNKSGNIMLVIKDNGIGVKPYDLPFLFDKGFTGDTGEQRKRSTGMGLYLAKQVADSLKFKIEVSEKYKDGFEISLLFPIIE
ncbi:MULTISPECIES: sensor histidine kinase [unclassified Clostridium]|uniref:sensor histidine kinase n=1 Tax=unclassified Clostridium TaxID=2614128 RepID=UPI0013F07847|nr:MULTISPECIES: sensor histidine kinase [unclassified Clostridium]NFG62636.1 HAMP domain-containing histidine kinase [Clostridium botulinum]NFQ10002.1 HAMP domain-containing histidine kinase [Clostridium botulinum]